MPIRSDLGNGPAITVGRPEHVLAAVERDGTLTLVRGHGEPVRFSVKPCRERVEGMLSPDYVLLYENGDTRFEVARGDHGAMEAMRLAISRGVSSHIRRSGGRRRTLLMAASGLVGLFVGSAIVVGLMPVPNAPPVIQAAPAATPGFMPGYASPVPSDPPTARQMPFGHYDRPVTPVPLENGDLSGGKWVSPPPVAPVGSTSTIKAPLGLTDVRPIEPPIGTNDLPPTAPARDTASTGVVPSTPVSGTPDIKPDVARRQLAAMEKLKAAIAAHGVIDKATLDDLPPDLAAKVMALPGNRGKGEARLTQQQVDQEPHDQFGVPTIPDSSSWAGIEGAHIPPPGGGDIRTFDDMRTFHLDPGNQGK